MKEFLLYHSLDEKTDWTLCEDYDEVTALIKENKDLFGKRYKALKAVRVGVAEEFEELVDAEPLHKNDQVKTVQMEDTESLTYKAEQWDKHQMALEKLKRETEQNRAVKKTLTIPYWLDQKALEHQINFSQTLKDALKEKLGL